MKALKFTKAKEFAYIEMDEPRIDDDQILIKVKAAGICHSDIVGYLGLHPYRIPPVVTGHEFSGVITEVGDYIGGTFKVGDNVFVEPHIGCGECYYCSQGDYNLCLNKGLIGVGDWTGCFGEFVVAYPSMCHKIPENISFEQAALAEPFCVGNHAVTIAEMNEEDTAIVLGCGTIGMMTIASLLNRGIKNVIGSDISQVKRDKALEIGASKVLNPMSQDVVREVLDVTDGLGADVVFIAANFPGATDQALQMSKKLGKVVVIALFDDKIDFDIEQVQQGERRLIGSSMYTDVDFRFVQEKFEQGDLQLGSLVTKTISFEEAGDVIDAMSKGKYGDEIKIIITY
jgi:L-iditol 2-dehydrogenase